MNKYAKILSEEKGERNKKVIEVDNKTKKSINRIMNHEFSGGLFKNTKTSATGLMFGGIAGLIVGVITKQNKWICALIGGVIGVAIANVAIKSD